MRQLIRIHTNEGDLVLDLAAGAMTTAIACILERRRFLCIEKHLPHYVLGVRRVRNLLKSLSAGSALTLAAD